MVGELVEECSEHVDENEMIYNETFNAIPLNDYKKACCSCAPYIVLFAIFLLTSTVISSVFSVILLMPITSINDNFLKNLSKSSILFFSDIKNVDLNLLSITKIYTENTDVVVYCIKYIMVESINNQNIDSENPLCHSFSDADAYIIEESESKYLIYALTKNNKKVLEIHKKNSRIKLKNKLK